MTIEGILIALVIGAIAGWLAGQIVKGAGFGLVGNIIIGIIGAFVASWVLPQVGLGFSTGNSIVTSILYATVGAVIVLVILSLIRRAT
ncbi:MAG: GlsB/YeaQ/YmgE family stress response membrane protein [Alphaproteobacteria bacterium]|nr:GlsB/YeaQ/YmgE family stress response membrane protein [Alphaproteobacteria bacterium]